jgi:putative ABC transport system permease protein
MIRNYLKTAWRGLRKNPVVNFIKIIGLSIGMSAAILIMLWVQSELTYDGYHEDADRIYRISYNIFANNGIRTMEYSPLLLANAVKKGLPEIQKTARLFTASWETPVFKVNGELFNEKNYAYVDEGWFDLFHYDIIAGDYNGFLKNPFSLIITESKARLYFQKRNPVGQMIKIDTVNYEVQAVIKDNPANSSFQFDVLIPLAAYLSNPAQRKNEESWSIANYLTFVKLAKSANSKIIEGGINKILDESIPAGKSTVSLLPLKEMHFERGSIFSAINRGNHKSIYILTTLALLLLFVACINYVNLTIANSSRHAREVSIRKIVGARFNQLFAQFMIEGFLVSFLSLILTFLMVWLLLPFFDTISGKHFVLDLLAIDFWRVSSGVFLFSLLLNSIYPALLLSSFKPLQVLRGMSMLKIKDGQFRNGLLVIQFVISIGLIIGTIVIFNQQTFIKKSNENQLEGDLFTVASPIKLYLMYGAGKSQSLMSLYKQELLLQSSIIDVAIGGSSAINIRNSASGNADWQGRNKNFNPQIALLNADQDYLKVFGLVIKEGRWFRPDDKPNGQNYILNETALKDLNIRQPALAQSFIIGRDTGQIIGVVKDFYYKNLHDKIGPLVIRKGPRAFNLYIKPSPGRTTEAVQTAKLLWEKLVPGFPFDYIFLNNEFDNLYREENRIYALVFTFSVISLFIAILGLLGLVSFAAEQRAKEIGIRKAVGASASHIVGLLSKSFLLLALLAFAIASPITWWVMNGWLQDFSYRTSMGWEIFAGAGIFVLIVVLITVGSIAIKAYITSTSKILHGID